MKKECRWYSDDANLLFPPSAGVLKDAPGPFSRSCRFFPFLFMEICSCMAVAAWGRRGEAQAARGREAGRKGERK